uniref:H15 domain-containing protein n=1 Tax=Pseudonaja textilis TaxID=8673 RepID=A0A670ZJX8_PSETE
MAEVAPVPAKKAAGAAKVRKPTGPSVTELLMQAVAASKDRGGISLAALKKSLAASGYDVEKNNSRLKLVLRSLVTKGTLLRIKGTGASGSFKLNKKRADPKDKATRKQQSAGAKNKKPTGGKKSLKILESYMSSVAQGRLCYLNAVGAVQMRMRARSHICLLSELFQPLRKALKRTTKKYFGV